MVQYVIIDLASLMTGGEVAVGPFDSPLEASLWNREKVGTVILELTDPLTAGVSDVEQACDSVRKQSGGRASDRKIQVIKELRYIRTSNGNHDKSGLKECKDDVEAYFAKNPTA